MSSTCCSAWDWDSQMTFVHGTRLHFDLLGCYVKLCGSGQWLQVKSFEKKTTKQTKKTASLQGRYCEVYRLN